MAISSSKSTLLFFVVLCSCSFTGTYSQANLPCVQQLLPCQPYMNGATPPTSTCCVPLKQIVATQVPCLCAVFNNAPLLKAFNVTQADALGLVKSCGANADTSLCGSAGTPPPGAPSTPATPSDNTSSTTTSPPPPHKKGAASTISHVGWSVCAAAVLSLIVSAN